MAKLDIKRVKEYMEELGYERDEAINLVKAEMEEESAAKKDFDDKTKTDPEDNKPRLTKEDVMQILADEKAKEKKIEPETKEDMSDVLKRLI